jgi:hypothetical protein
VEVDDLGELIGSGEFWQFSYRACGHVTYFPRDRSIAGGYDPTWLIRDIREHYATCFECAHLQPELEPQLERDAFWWLRDTLDVGRQRLSQDVDGQVGLPVWEPQPHQVGKHGLHSGQDARLRHD